MGSNKGIPHRKWGKEEKLEIVKLHLEKHQSIKSIEKKYGIQHSIVSTWEKKFLEEGEAGLEPQKRGGKTNMQHCTEVNH